MTQMSYTVPGFPNLQLTMDSLSRLFDDLDPDSLVLAVYKFVEDAKLTPERRGLIVRNFYQLVPCYFELTGSLEQSRWTKAWCAAWYARPRRSPGSPIGPRRFDVGHEMAGRVCSLWDSRRDLYVTIVCHWIRVFRTSGWIFCRRWALREWTWGKVGLWRTGCRRGGSWWRSFFISFRTRCMVLDVFFFLISPKNYFPI